MKAKPSGFFGGKAAAGLTLPTFSVTSKSAKATPKTKKDAAYNIGSLEQIASESADRQRALTRR